MSQHSLIPVEGAQSEVYPQSSLYEAVCVNASVM